MPTPTETIREAIRRSGLSQYELAKRTGIRQSALSRFLAGSGITTDTIDLLAPVVGFKVVIDRPRKGGTKGR